MTAKRLMTLANTKKCVVWMSGRPVPATFVVGIPFRFVMWWLPKIKEYKTKRK